MHIVDEGGDRLRDPRVISIAGLRVVRVWSDLSATPLMSLVGPILGIRTVDVVAPPTSTLTIRDPDLVDAFDRPETDAGAWLDRAAERDRRLLPACTLFARARAEEAARAAS
jgi:hypothetical protein